MILRRVAYLLIGVLVACARPATAPPLPMLQEASVRALPATDYHTLYSFTGYPSGASPTNVTYSHGALYGTTQNGGSKTFGTIFVRNATGVHVLHNFNGGASDGATPTGTLVPLGGKLYGFTEYGGAAGDGTVFSVTPRGVESVVYSFKGGTDGATPVFGQMAVINGTLYGTTSAGGNSGCRVDGSIGCGVVFSLTPSGTESVLYRFGGKPDGAAPIGALLDVNGTLYGTTSSGGRYNSGTVFSLTTAKSETVVYSFKGFPDGAGPYAGLTEMNGTLYGTTAFGGSYDNSGTIYSINASGVEQVLHSFRGYPDGALPYAGMTAVGGVMYGTTEYGGESGHKCTGHGVIGCGIIFKLTAAEKESTVYTFKGNPNGSTPWSSLVDVAGTLYGTTLLGGKGEGTIYSIGVPTKR